MYGPDDLPAAVEPGPPFSDHDLVQTTDPGNVFDERAGHPFSLPVRSFWILPHFREAFRQSKNLFGGLRRYALSDQPQPLEFLLGFPHQA